MTWKTRRSHRKIRPSRFPRTDRRIASIHRLIRARTKRLCQHYYLSERVPDLAWDVNKDSDRGRDSEWNLDSFWIVDGVGFARQVKAEERRSHVRDIAQCLTHAPLPYHHHQRHCSIDEQCKNENLNQASRPKERAQRADQLPVSAAETANEYERKQEPQT